MRIALLCCDPLAGSAESVGCSVRLRSLAEALVRAGHTVSAISASADSDTPPSDMAGLEIRPLRLPVTVREIDWHFSRIQPELVIERMLPFSHEGAQAAAEAGIAHVYDVSTPLVADAHDPRDLHAATSRALQFTSGVLAGSSSAARWVGTFVNTLVPVTVLPGAAGAHFMRPVSPSAIRGVEQRLRLGAGEFRVGFLGAFTAESGVLELVRAVGAIHKERPARLVLMGDGPLRNAVLREAFEQGTPIVLCGRVPHERVPAHVAACHAIAIPGDRGDAYRAPLSLHESLALSRPVVALQTPAIASVVRDGRDAILIDSVGENAETLRAALMRLAQDGTLGPKLGAEGRRTVEREHTWDALAERAVRFAKELPARTSGGHEEPMQRVSSR